MKAIDGNKLIELLESAALAPASYSGRAMYGKRCVSVTVEPAKALSVGSDLVFAADGLEEYEDGDLAERVAMLMHSAREDDMGRDVVVYWPGVAWPVEVEG